MSLVVKNRDSMMRILAAGLAVLAPLALTGCSRENASREIVSFRDRVVANAATAEARRALQPNPQDYDGSGYRHAPKPESPKPPGQTAGGTTNPDGTAIDPTAPPKPFQGQTAAPPTVYYYPAAPSAAPAPAP
jgi:hypothetical protein